MTVHFALISRKFLDTQSNTNDQKYDAKKKKISLDRRRKDDSFEIVYYTIRVQLVSYYLTW